MNENIKYRERERSSYGISGSGVNIHICMCTCMSFTEKHAQEYSYLISGVMYIYLKKILYYIYM